MRLFVAIEIPNEAKYMIGELQNSLPAKLKPVSREAMHITLKFIGESPEANLKRVISSLEKIAHPSLDISLSGAGAFPSPKTPSVLWVGCQSDSLASLAHSIDSSLEAAGIAKDPRPYSPHLTIARATGHVDISEFVRANKDFSAGSFQAEEFHLFKSLLLPSGAVHSKLASFALR